MKTRASVKTSMGREGAAFTHRTNWKNSAVPEESQALVGKVQQIMGHKFPVITFDMSIYQVLIDE